jgi:glycerol-3-phosphate dehydrogenase
MTASLVVKTAFPSILLTDVREEIVDDVNRIMRRERRRLVERITGEDSEKNIIYALHIMEEVLMAVPDEAIRDKLRSITTWLNEMKLMIHAANLAAACAKTEIIYNEPRHVSHRAIMVKEPT